LDNTHTHEIFFEATKNANIYITFFLLQQCQKQKKAMVEKGGVQILSFFNGGGLL
jgi:hypothetical protein